MNQQRCLLNNERGCYCVPAQKKVAITPMENPVTDTAATAEMQIKTVRHTLEYHEGVETVQKLACGLNFVATTRAQGFHRNVQPVRFLL